MTQVAVERRTRSIYPGTPFVQIPPFLTSYGIEVLSLLAGAGLWEILGRTLRLDWLPPFSEVVADMVELAQSGVIFASLAVSLQALAVGFGMALVAGLILGALMGRYRTFGEAIEPFVYALFVAPQMVFVPIFFAIFGLSDGTRVALIVMYSIFVITINTSVGVRGVDQSLVEMARSFGATDRQLLWRILLPAALPLVFAGVRLGLGRAVKGMINAEMFIALVGLGALVERYGAQFDAAKVFAVSMFILIVAIIANALVQIAESRVLRWMG